MQQLHQAGWGRPPTAAPGPRAGSAGQRRRRAARALSPSACRGTPPASCARAPSGLQGMLFRTRSGVRLRLRLRVGVRSRVRLMLTLALRARVRVRVSTGVLQPSRLPAVGDWWGCMPTKERQLRQWSQMCRPSSPSCVGLSAASLESTRCNSCSWCKFQPVRMRCNSPRHQQTFTRCQSAVCALLASLTAPDHLHHGETQQTCAMTGQRHACGVRSSSPAGVHGVQRGLVERYRSA